MINNKLFTHFFNNRIFNIKYFGECTFSTFVDERRQQVQDQMPRVSDLDAYKQVLSGEKRRSIRRSDFLKFTGGKRPIISSHLKSNVVATGLVIWCIFAFFLTYKVMKPESYEWVENERKRIEAAKKKIELILKEEGDSTLLSNKNLKVHEIPSIF